MQCEVNNIFQIHPLNLSHYLHLTFPNLAGLPAARLLCADGHMPALHQGDLINCDQGCPDEHHCENIARYGACCPDNIEDALELWRRNNIGLNNSHESELENTERSCKLSVLTLQYFIISHTCSI